LQYLISELQLLYGLSQLWFSRLDSWSQDSFFSLGLEQLILVWFFGCFFVAKLALVNEDEHL